MFAIPMWCYTTSVITEEQVQMQLAEYMRLQYPQVLFRSDLGGVRLSPGLRMRMARLQSGRSWPDFFVAYPSHGYHGLFIEIKSPTPRFTPTRCNWWPTLTSERSTPCFSTCLRLAIRLSLGWGLSVVKCSLTDTLAHLYSVPFTHWWTVL